MIGLTIQTERHRIGSDPREIVETANWFPKIYRKASLAVKGLPSQMEGDFVIAIGADRFQVPPPGACRRSGLSTLTHNSEAATAGLSYGSRRRVFADLYTGYCNPDMATPLVVALAAAEPAFAQKAGGILKMYSPDSPASMSIHEEATFVAEGPMMEVFNNLVVFDQHVKQNSLDSIVSDLATGWSWNVRLELDELEGTERITVTRNRDYWLHRWRTRPDRCAARHAQPSNRHWSIASRCRCSGT
jgi:hypothetical protein